MNRKLLTLTFACFIFVLGIIRWYVGAQRHDGLLFLITGLSLVMAVMANKPGGGEFSLPILGVFERRLFFNLWFVFMMGASLAMLRDRLRLHPVAVAAACGWVIASVPLHVFWPLCALGLPYALIGVSYYLPRLFRRLGSSTDISYGMYLYGFPVTQLLIALRTETEIGLMPPLCGSESVPRRSTVRAPSPAPP